MNNQKIMFRVLRLYVPVVIISTVFFLFLYVINQQNIRLSANDPQIGMSEDAAFSLAYGNPVNSLISGKIDISKSLSPYIIIFDNQGKPVSSSAVLDNLTPLPPSGVFDYAQKHGQDRFTWQPKPGIRSAAVITHYNGKNSGFVLVGRSLREVEIREDQILALAVFGWVTSLITTFIAVIFFEVISLKGNKTR